MSGDLRVVFKDPVRGCDVSVGLAFGCGLSVRVKGKTVSTSSLSYAGPERGRHVSALGHTLTLSDGDRYSVAAAEASSVIPQIHNMAVIAAITHNVPPRVRRENLTATVVTDFQHITWPKLAGFQGRTADRTPREWTQSLSPVRFASNRKRQHPQASPPASRRLCDAYDIEDHVRADPSHRDARERPLISIPTAGLAVDGISEMGSPLSTCAVSAARDNLFTPTPMSNTTDREHRSGARESPPTPPPVSLASRPAAQRASYATEMSHSGYHPGQGPETPGLPDSRYPSSVHGTPANVSDAAKSTCFPMSPATRPPSFGSAVKQGQGAAVDYLQQPSGEGCPLAPMPTASSGDRSVKHHPAPNSEPSDEPLLLSPPALSVVGGAGAAVCGSLTLSPKTPSLSFTPKTPSMSFTPRRTTVAFDELALARAAANRGHPPDGSDARDTLQQPPAPGKSNSVLSSTTPVYQSLQTIRTAPVLERFLYEAPLADESLARTTSNNNSNGAFLKAPSLLSASPRESIDSFDPGQGLRSATKARRKRPGGMRCRPGQRPRDGGVALGLMSPASGFAAEPPLPLTPAPPSPVLNLPGGMRAKHQPPWVWHELQKREGIIHDCESRIRTVESKMTALQREVNDASEKAIRETATAERLRLQLQQQEHAPGTLTDLSIKLALPPSQAQDGSPRKATNWRKRSPGAVNGAKPKPKRRAEPKTPDPDAAVGQDPQPNVPLNADMNLAMLRNLRKLQDEEGDAAAIMISLDVIKAAVGPATLTRELRKWISAGKTNENVQTSGQPKFGDGIAQAKTPDQIEKLDFFPPNYTPPHDVRKTISDLKAWRAPQGTLWPTSTVTDLLGNLGVTEKYHSSGQEAGLVLPFYAYSLSVFKSVVWVTWIGSKMVKPTWEVLTAQADHLEDAFAHMDPDRGELSIEPSLFNNIRGLGQLPNTFACFTKFGSETLGISVFKQDKYLLVRYKNALRGDTNASPLYDSVLWLPMVKAGSGSVFPKPLSSLPPPGLIEYLYSRMSSENLDWASDWRCRQAIGPDAVALIKTCMASIDQQKVDFALTKAFDDLMVNDVAIMGPEYQQDRKKKATLASATLAAIRLIARARNGDKDKLSPQSIAHALDIQRLDIRNSSYCINLASAPFLVVEIGKDEKPEIIEIQRLKHGYSDQIYWHINAAMRNLQFGFNETFLVVEHEDKDVTGKYVAVNPPLTYAESVEALSLPNKPTPLHREGDFPRKATYSASKRQYLIRNGDGTVVAAVKPDMTHFQIGVWMVQQVQPIQYYLEEALKLLRRIDASGLPHEVVAAPDGCKNYRGLAGVILDRRVYDTGKIVLWGQFSSSSLDRGVASNFAKGDTTAAVFTLIGRSCVCIATWSRFARESEWLYPPNTLFRVTNCLAEEHQMILDKQNLQLFSMSEVDEYAAIETYLRSLVPLITGDDAPQYVMQLFHVIHYVGKKDPENALKVLLQPEQQALFTPEGLRVGRKLVGLCNSLAPVNVNLLRAAAGGYEEAVLTLLNLGGEVEVANQSHLTSLQLGAVGGHYGVVKALIKAGAKQEARGGGFYAIELAAMRRDHALTELLKESCPALEHVIPSRLEEFMARVTLPAKQDLRFAVEAVGLKWDRTRARQAGKSATVVLFDRGKNLFWLKFDDDTTDLYPSTVLFKENDAVEDRFEQSASRRKSGPGGVGSARHRSHRHSSKERASMHARRFSTSSATSRPPEGAARKPSGPLDAPAPFVLLPSPMAGRRRSRAPPVPLTKQRRHSSRSSATSK
ncbi:hypothetical protein DIPPA_04300 [Diplonema papillatum]|nr:hypothetical protein DIPPA_04300 [Diplonema papillatum]